MRRFLQRGGGILVAAFAVAPLLAAAASESSAPLRPYHEAGPDRPVLALTPGLVGAEFADLLDRLSDAGLVVPVAFPGTGLVLRDRGAVDVALGLEASVRASFRGPVDASSELGRSATPAAHGFLQWWNDGFEDPAVLTARKRAARADAPRRDPSQPIRICAGSKTLEEALQERGGDRNARCGMNPAFRRIHFANGRFIVNLIFPEFGTDFWNPIELAQVTSDITRAMNWWNLKSDGWASFVVVEHGTVRVQHDPSELLMDEEDQYIADAMATLGYAGLCPYEAVDRLNTDNRDTYRGHWGFTQFALNQNSFAGAAGVLAYAYLGGPHTVCLRGNGGYPDALAQVVAHEYGHIFQALDEYSAGCAGCAPRAGYLNEQNGNCATCGLQVGKCIMRNAATYDAEERENMETMIHPCRFTKGQVGIRDENPPDGIPDVMRTVPETEVFTVLPDTLDGTRNVPVLGRAWDQPYAGAPAQYDPAVTINTILKVEFSIDGLPWASAIPLDDFFTEQEEDWELRIPELGGGLHRITVRAVNSVGGIDTTPPVVEAFVYNVKLRKELEIIRSGSRFALVWIIDGEDFGSEYSVWRTLEGGDTPNLVGTIASPGRKNNEFVWWDESVLPGEEYIYRLDVDIPDRGIKTLGLVRETAVLDDPGSGHFVKAGPNPSRGDVLFTVTVPIGPRPNQDDQTGLPDNDGNGGGIRPSGPAGRDGPDDVGSGTATPLWRDVTLSVYDVTGRLVRVLAKERQLETTRFNSSWNGTDRDGAPVPPGVYFVKTDLDYISDLTKVVILR